MRTLRGVLLFTLVAFSICASVKFIIPAQATPDSYPWGTHDIYLNYYQTKIADDHDTDYGTSNPGEWYFKLSWPGGYTSSGEVLVSKPPWVPPLPQPPAWVLADHVDLTCTSTTASSFTMWAGELDGIIFPTWDYVKEHEFALPEDWGYYVEYKPGIGHYGNYITGDVWFYWYFHIYNNAPTADPIYDHPTVYVGEDATFTGSGSDTEGDDIYYRWDFGDGHWTMGTLATTTHSYTTAGTYTVTFDVIDYFEEWSSPKTATITVIQPGTEADLVGRSAWPEHHKLVRSKQGDAQTLYGLVGNTGNEPLAADEYKVVWEVTYPDGHIGTYETVGTAELSPRDKIILTCDLDVSADSGRYDVVARCYCDGKAGDKIKKFSFSVVP